MTMTNPTVAKQKARAELSVLLNRLRVIHGLSELDAMEVFNAVGATFFKELLEDRAVGLATPVPQDQHPRLKDDETGVIPAIRVDRMGYSQVPRSPGGLMVGNPNHKRSPGNETSAVHDD